MDNEQNKPDPLAEQHAQAFGELATAAAAESPAPGLVVPPLNIEMPVLPAAAPARPVDEARAIDDPMLDLWDISSKEYQRKEDAALAVQQNARERANERKHRLGKPPIVEHNEAFADLGHVSIESDEAYGPKPLTAEPADVDDMAFPHRDQSADLSSAFRAYLEEDRKWRNTLTDFIKTLTGEVTQHRLELDLLRGNLERGRLS